MICISKEYGRERGKSEAYTVYPWIRWLVDVYTLYTYDVPTTYYKIIIIHYVFDGWCDWKINLSEKGMPLKMWLRQTCILQANANQLWCTDKMIKIQFEAIILMTMIRTTHNMTTFDQPRLNIISKAKRYHIHENALTQH